jgi:hypothetical protein
MATQKIGTFLGNPPKPHNPNVPHAGTGRVGFSRFTVCIAHLDRPGGIAAIYQERNSGDKWPRVFKRAINKRQIREPGLYLGWYHAPVNCSNCGNTSSGAYVVMSVIYTVEEIDGELVATEGVHLRQQETPKRLITWPPK